MLTQIEQRHTEMQELEKSMLDLYQVFLDMSVVVAEQGDMLDRIEGWVSPCPLLPVHLGKVLQDGSTVWV